MLLFLPSSLGQDQPHHIPSLTKGATNWSNPFPPILTSKGCWHLGLSVSSLEKGTPYQETHTSDADVVTYVHMGEYRSSAPCNHFQSTHMFTEAHVNFHGHTSAGEGPKDQVHFFGLV
uniref:Uncharacterized protein n=1 Tax=Sphaerodactylus townsendi TaxID=933632 RepID=A0ACB8EIC3_9SAUR